MLSSMQRGCMLEFSSLHNHSEDGSQLDGFSPVEEYVASAVRLGHRAVGLTDHGGMNGLNRLIKSANKAGITPVPGCELYMAPDNPLGARVQERVFYGGGGEGDVSSRGAYTHLTAWAYNDDGVRNLYKLSELGSREEHRVTKHPRIDLDILERHNSGLIVSTGCPSSELNTRLALGQVDAAVKYLDRMVEIFGDRIFFEVMFHDMALEKQLIRAQMRLRSQLDGRYGKGVLRLLATNDAHYTRPEQAVGHEQMLCMNTGSSMYDKTVDEGGTRFAFNGSGYYMKSADEMYAALRSGGFSEDDAKAALTDTSVIAEMCEGGFSVVEYDQHRRPSIDLGGEDDAAYLERIAREGIKTRYPRATADDLRVIDARIREEMAVISNGGFEQYFLIIKHVVDYANEHFSVRDKHGNALMYAVGQGRGSAPGSLVLYLIGGTNVDPIKYGLLFERFLSDGRGNVMRVDAGDRSWLVPSAALILLEDGTRKRCMDIVFKGSDGGEPDVLDDHALDEYPLVCEDIAA